MAEECQHLVADPLRRGHTAGSKRVRSGDFDIVSRHGARRYIPLGRRDEANSQRLRQIADPSEEPRGVGRAVELKTGEVVVMDPLMQQRLEKDLGGEHLLPNGRQVVDPDGATLRRGLPGDPVVAVGFQFQPAGTSAVSLGTIRHRQFAGRKSSGFIKHVKQSLAVQLAPRGGGLIEDGERNAFAKRKLAPGDGLDTLAAFVSGSGHAPVIMGRMPQSSIIVVGNEILTGFTVDTNSHWLAGRLFHVGYPVRLMTTVGDIDADIVAAIREHTARRDIARIFVCGGLGPTPDDRTYVALGRALNQPLVYRRDVGAAMQNLMFVLNMASRRGTAELNAGNRKMAMLPEGANLIRNGAGMAPGLAFDLDQGRYLFALPGVPHELRSIYEDIEIRYLSGGQADVVRELHYRLAPESMFHDVMQALEQEYPDVSLGSYPQTETRELILRASGPNVERVDAVIAAIRKQVSQYKPLH